MARANRVDAIARAHVLEVAQDWVGQVEGFPDNESWRVIIEGRAYPARGILRECIRAVTGEELNQGSVPTGNQYHDANKVLGRLGFSVLKAEEMTGVEFEVGQQYSRDDVQRELGSRPAKGGNWATGHNRFGLDTYIFATTDDAGATGHDYDNRLDGDHFYWQTKNTVNTQSPSFLSMVGSDGDTHIFTREKRREAFTYHGKGIAESWTGDNPVSIKWRLIEGTANVAASNLTRVTANEGEEVYRVTKHRKRESKLRIAKILQYERLVCEVCDLNLTEQFGELASKIIEAHHLDQLAKGVRVTTLDDLALLCPTCHKLVHTQTPMMTLDEARGRI